jgi:hypothetical protein
VPRADGPALFNESVTWHAGDIDFAATPVLPTFGHFAARLGGPLSFNAAVVYSLTVETLISVPDHFYKLFEPPTTAKS